MRLCSGYEYALFLLIPEFGHAQLGAAATQSVTFPNIALKSIFLHRVHAIQSARRSPIFLIARGGANIYRLHMGIAVRPIKHTRLLHLLHTSAVCALLSRPPLPTLLCAIHLADLVVRKCADFCSPIPPESTTPKTLRQYKHQPSDLCVNVEEWVDWGGSGGLQISATCTGVQH